MVTTSPRRHRRVGLVGILVMLAVILVPGTAAAAPAPGMAKDAFCFHRPAGVPDAAYDIEDYVRSHNFSPPRSYVGGRRFENREGKIAAFPGEVLREYDLYPKNGREDRGQERIVIAAVPLRAWYTSDHYTTFIDMYPLSCFTWYLP